MRSKSRELETALRRIDISAAQRALAKAAEIPAAAPASGDTPLDALLGTETWRDLESHLSKAMTDFFQLPFTSTRTREDRAERFVEGVSLSDPSQQLELALSVVVDDARLHVHRRYSDDRGVRREPRRIPQIERALTDGARRE